MEINRANRSQVAGRREVDNSERGRRKYLNLLDSKDISKSTGIEEQRGPLVWNSTRGEAKR